MSRPRFAERTSPKSDKASTSGPEVLSGWTVSRRKRIFDIAVVLALSPILILLLLAIALAVLALSGKPVLFRQGRIGCDGRWFVIYKFRTMRRSQSAQHKSATLRPAEEITSLGRVLRRFKLDELPQVFNVLKGDMSLVGPRPKIPEQQFIHIPCRPGLTGSATLAFAQEEQLLAQIPGELLHDFYQTRILPTKHQIDTQYQQRATFISDFIILFDTAIECLRAFSAPAPRCHDQISAAQLLPDVNSAQTTE